MEKELSIKNKYYRYFPLRFWTERMIKKRTKQIVDSFDSFIKPEDRVLDIGAGAGWVAQEIEKRKGLDIILLDIDDFNQTNLSVQLYNGKEIPFSDNSFDVVLLNFVLHHSKNPLQVLKEAKRVARDRIIIFEDTYNSFFSKIILCFWDILINLPSFLAHGQWEQMSFEFKKSPEWVKVLENLGLRVIHTKNYCRKKIIKQTLYIVKK